MALEAVRVPARGRMRRIDRGTQPGEWLRVGGMR